METHILIENTHGLNLYSIAYQLAFLVTLGFIVFLGIKSKFNLLAWLLFILAIRTALVFGTKMPFSEWSSFSNLLMGQSPEMATGKTILTGLVLALIVFFTLRKVLKIPAKAADIMALSLPLGMAIQRFGCLFAGCCFGTPTDGSWGLMYGPLSEAGHYYLHNHPEGATCTAPLHPVQIYMILANALIFVVGLRYLGKWKAGKLAFAVFAAVIFSRFGIEFFRDSATNIQGAEILFGLKKLQWVLLAVALAFLTLAIKTPTMKSFPAADSQRAAVRVGGWLLLTVSAVLVALSRWFQDYESLVLLMVFVPAVFVWFYQLYHSTQVKTKWYPAALGIAALLFSSQTVVEPLNDSTEEKKIYKRVGLSYTGGAMGAREVVGGGGCNGTSSTYHYHAENQSAGGEYEHIIVEGGNTTIFSGRLMAGANSFQQWNDANFEYTNERSEFVLGQLYYQYKSPHLNFGIGVSGGNYYHNLLDNHRIAPTILPNASFGFNITQYFTTTFFYGNPNFATMPSQNAGLFTQINFANQLNSYVGMGVSLRGRYVEAKYLTNTGLYFGGGYTFYRNRQFLGPDFTNYLTVGYQFQ